MKLSNEKTGHHKTDIGGGVEVYIVDSIKRNHLVNARVGEHHIIF